MKKYYSGAIFPSRKKVGSKSPDYTGDLEITPELLQHLNDLHKAGKDIKMDIAGWLKSSRNNPDNRFISITAKPKREQGTGGLADALLSTQQGKKSSEWDDDIPF